MRALPHACCTRADDYLRIVAVPPRTGLEEANFRSLEGVITNADGGCMQQGGAAVVVVVAGGGGRRADGRMGGAGRLGRWVGARAGGNWVSDLGGPTCT